MNSRPSRSVSLAMTAALLVGTFSIVVALVVGCGSGSTLTAQDSQPAQPDAGATGAWSFAPATGDGPAAALKVAAIDGDKATLQLVVSGVPKLQGIAFRLAFDPARLKVSKTEQSAVWTTGDWFPTVARFAPRSNGELWGGLGYVGSHKLDASLETVVAQLEVELLGNDPVKVSFQPQRSLVIDPNNQSLEVSWLGGTFTRAAK